MAVNGEKHTGPTYELPSEATLKQVGELSILDEQNKAVDFKSLFTDQPAGERQMIVFIRHFFCGICEEYVRALARDLPPATLAAASAKLTIIGCGEPACVAEYKKRTGCPFDIYCDPTRAVYRKLNLVVNLGGGKRPAYFTKSFAAMVFQGIWTGITSGKQALQAGNYKQNGGEYLFADGNLTWCHRMTNTMDHAEIKELKEVLGMKEAEQ